MNKDVIKSSLFGFSSNCFSSFVEPIKEYHVTTFSVLVGPLQECESNFLFLKTIAELLGANCLTASTASLVSSDEDFKIRGVAE